MTNGIIAAKDELDELGLAQPQDTRREVLAPAATTAAMGPKAQPGAEPPPFFPSSLSSASLPLPLPSTAPSHAPSSASSASGAGSSSSADFVSASASASASTSTSRSTTPETLPTPPLLLAPTSESPRDAFEPLSPFSVHGRASGPGPGPGSTDVERIDEERATAVPDRHRHRRRRPSRIGKPWTKEEEEEEEEALLELGAEVVEREAMALLQVARRLRARRGCEEPVGWGGGGECVGVGVGVGVGDVDQAGGVRPSFASTSTSTSKRQRGQKRRLEHESDSTTRRSEAAEGFIRTVKLVMRAVEDRGDGRGSRGKVVIAGVGKSGIISRKLVATFLSLSIPSVYLHPTEALHGDLGLVRRGDVVLLVSHSGSTPELLALLPHLLARDGVSTVAVTGRRECELVRRGVDVWVDAGTGTRAKRTGAERGTETGKRRRMRKEGKANGASGAKRQQRTAADASSSSAGAIQTRSAGASAERPERPEAVTSDDAESDTEAERDEPAGEAWDAAPVPTSSTTVALAVGDALAVAVAEAMGAGRQTFAGNHPGGAIGVALG